MHLTHCARPAALAVSLVVWGCADRRDFPAASETCVSDGDCTGIDVCYRGFCFGATSIPCSSGADCAAGDACDEADGVCVAGGGGCRSDVTV